MPIKMRAYTFLPSRHTGGRVSKPQTYYNEHDGKTAAWLRELIRMGVIAPGDVDERDIQVRETMRSKGPDLAATACLAAWPTGSATDAKGSAKVGQRRGQLSEAVLLLASWNSPKASDGMEGLSDG